MHPRTPYKHRQNQKPYVVELGIAEDTPMHRLYATVRCRIKCHSSAKTTHMTQWQCKTSSVPVQTSPSMNLAHGSSPLAIGSSDPMADQGLKVVYS